MRIGDLATSTRVRLIQQLYGAGLSSRTIAELLPCVDAGVSTPESRERLAASLGATAKEPQASGTGSTCRSPS